VLGCFRASVMTLREWTAKTRSDAECAFCSDYPLFNARHSAGLIASAFGCGNVVALVNDGRGSRDTERPCNCALIEVLVRGCPALVLVTLAPISTGEELLRSYGDAFWARLQAAGAASAGEGTAEPVELAPLVRQRSKSSANERGLALAPAAAPDAAEAAGLGAAADTASFGGGRATVGNGPWAAAAVPVSVAAQALDSGVPTMSLVARLGRCAGDAAPTCLAGALRLHGTTKGDDPAATLQPLLAQCHRCAFVLAPPSDASPQARAALAKFAARLIAKGKAARCDEAVSGGRGVYLLPPGALASGMLALLGVPPLPEAVAAAPHLLAFVLRATAPAPPLAAAASAPPLPLAAAALAPPPAAAVAAPPPPVDAVGPPPEPPAPAAAPPLERPAAAAAATAVTCAEPIQLPAGLLELAFSYFRAPERAGRELHLEETTNELIRQVKSGGMRGVQLHKVSEMLYSHPAFRLSGSRLYVSLRTDELAAGAAPLLAAVPSVQPPPRPQPAPPPSASLKSRFPPELLELAVSFFTAPERVGREHYKSEATCAIYTMWQQNDALARMVRLHGGYIRDLLDEHPTVFVCDRGRVSLRSWGAEPAMAAAAPVACAAAAPEAADTAEHARRKRSRSRSPPSKRAAVAEEQGHDATLRLNLLREPQRSYNARLHAWLRRQGRWCHVGEEVFAALPPPPCLLGPIDQPRIDLLHLMRMQPARYALSAHQRFVCCAREADGEPEHGPLPIDDRRFLWSFAAPEMLSASAAAHAARHPPGAGPAIATAPPAIAPSMPPPPLLVCPSAIAAGPVRDLHREEEASVAPDSSEAASSEAAYIADVVRLLRRVPHGGLSLPILGNRCPLPADLKARGCLAVLLAHRDVLAIYRPTKHGSHLVRLAPHAATTLPVVGAAVAHDAAVAEAHASRKRSRSRSRSRSCSPPSKRADLHGSQSPPPPAATTVPPAPPLPAPAPAAPAWPMLAQHAYRFLSAPENLGAWMAMPLVMHAVALSIDLEQTTERRAWLLQELKVHLPEEPAFEVQHGHVRLALPHWPRR
jgi:hypothetical protein